MTTAQTTEGDLAANVTAALVEAERSVAWLSRQTGIKRTTLTYQIKRGRFPVTNLLLIAKALGLDIEELLATAKSDAA